MILWGVGVGVSQIVGGNIPRDRRPSGIFVTEGVINLVLEGAITACEEKELVSLCGYKSVV